MSASLRFLVIAVVGWAGVRAATLGTLPGTEAFTLGRAEQVRVAATSDVPAIVPTEFPPIDPVAQEMSPLDAQLMPGPRYPMAYGARPTAAAIPIYYYPVSIPGGAPLVQASLPAPRRGRA